MANLSSRLRELTDDYLEVCGTIREMKETSGEILRSGSLLSRIEKFLKTAYLVSRMGGKMPKGKDAVQPDENEADADGLRKIHCGKGRLLFRQGDEADCMYYIASGTVGIYANYETDDEKLLTTLKSNQFFGEMGMIEKLPRSAAAVADSNGTVLKVITEADLEGLCKKAPSMVLMALQHLSSRLRTLTVDYVQACQTVEKMVDAEEHGRELAEEYMKSIEYYTIMAQAYNNTMYY
jgi:CRP-like cAMP-binding protein